MASNRQRTPSKGTPESKAEVLANVCAELSTSGVDAAAETLRANYPFVAESRVTRRYTERQCLRVFFGDGFIDRYSGTQLVNPAVLRTLSVIFPEAFPAHPNWKMSDTHFAFWELFPTIDHLIPVSRGGVDDETNWVTASMLRNSAKAHWTLDELGWQLFAAGDLNDWDGLSSWLVEYTSGHRDLLMDKYISRWYRATVQVRSEWDS